MNLDDGHRNRCASHRIASNHDHHEKVIGDDGRNRYSTNRRSSYPAAASSSTSASRKGPIKGNVNKRRSSSTTADDDNNIIPQHQRNILPSNESKTLIMTKTELDCTNLSDTSRTADSSGSEPFAVTDDHHRHVTPKNTKKKTNGENNKTMTARGGNHHDGNNRSTATITTTTTTTDPPNKKTNRRRSSSIPSRLRIGTESSSATTKAEPKKPRQQQRQVHGSNEERKSWEESSSSLTLIAPRNDVAITLSSPKDNLGRRSSNGNPVSRRLANRRSSMGEQPPDKTVTTSSSRYSRSEEFRIDENSVPPDLRGILSPRLSRSKLNRASRGGGTTKEAAAANSKKENITALHHQSESSLVSPRAIHNESTTTTKMIKSSTLRLRRRFQRLSITEGRVDEDNDDKKSWQHQSESSLFLCPPLVVDDVGITEPSRRRCSRRSSTGKETNDHGRTKDVTTALLDHPPSESSSSSLLFPTPAAAAASSQPRSPALRLRRFPRRSSAGGGGCSSDDDVAVVFHQSESSMTHISIDDIETTKLMSPTERGGMENDRKDVTAVFEQSESSLSPIVVAVGAEVNVLKSVSHLRRRRYPRRSSTETGGGNGMDSSSKTDVITKSFEQSESSSSWTPISDSFVSPESPTQPQSKRTSCRRHHHHRNNSTDAITMIPIVNRPTNHIRTLSLDAGFEEVIKNDDNNDHHHDDTSISELFSPIKNRYETKKNNESESQSSFGLFGATESSSTELTLSPIPRRHHHHRHCSISNITTTTSTVNQHEPIDTVHGKEDDDDDASITEEFLPDSTTTTTSTKKATTTNGNPNHIKLDVPSAAAIISPSRQSKLRVEDVKHMDWNQATTGSMIDENELIARIQQVRLEHGLNDTKSSSCRLVCHNNNNTLHGQHRSCLHGSMTALTMPSPDLLTPRQQRQRRRGSTSAVETVINAVGSVAAKVMSHPKSSSTTINHDDEAKKKKLQLRDKDRTRRHRCTNIIDAPSGSTRQIGLHPTSSNTRP